MAVLDSPFYQQLLDDFKALEEKKSFHEKLVKNIERSVQNVLA